MNSRAQIDSVLFDLDGTLIDSLPGIEFSALRAMELCNARVLKSDFRSLLGPPIREILRQISGCDESERLDEFEKAFRSVYDGGAWQNASLFPEVRETLDALASSGRRLFVVTNKPGVPAQRVLDHLGIWPLFTALVSPDHRQPAFKTKAEALCQLRDQWRLPVERMLFVGDALDDAQAAAVCGCRFAAVEFGYGAASSQRVYPVHFKLRSMGDLFFRPFCQSSC